MNQFEYEDQYSSIAGLKEYFHLFWAWAWLIVAAGVLAGVSAYGFSIRSTPVYETSTRLLISEPPALYSIDYTAMLDSWVMAPTYAEMLLDRPVLEGVIDTLDLQMGPDELKGAISVLQVRDTQLLEVTVKNTDPILAANVANTLAAVFADRVRELQSERYAATKDGLTAQVSDMELQIEETSKALAIETNASKELQLEARLTEYRRLYADLVTNFEQVRLAEAQTSTNVVVSEPADIPMGPVSPRTMRNTLLAVMVGMLLAAGTIFAVDMLDDTVKNPEEIRRRFNLPVLGTIAVHTVNNGSPISLAEPRSPVTESFRALRTNLTFAGVDKPLRRLLVTSPTPQAGKTTISANLAVVMAQGSKKVALLDADLRRPQIHNQFGLLNRSGLSALFTGSLDALPSALQSVDQPRLALLTSGNLPPNPVELLTSQRMGHILDRLNQEYDLIVLDTPPVLSVTDAAALAPGMDGVLLVVKPGVTKLSALEQTIEQLNGVRARLLGVVLNEVNPRSRRYGYYYSRYDSKYAYYYEDGGTDKKTRKVK